MEIARHWRNNRVNLRLEGIKKTHPDGKQEISFTGSSWTEIPSNGRSHEEKPLTGITIYKAPVLQGKNGGNGRSHESVEISVAMEASVMAD